MLLQQRMVILAAILSSADFFPISTFSKIKSGITSECQTVWIQIRPHTLSGLIFQRLSADEKIVGKSWITMDQYCFNITCLKRPLKRSRQNMFEERYSLTAGQKSTRLMQVKKYCRMLPWGILHYFGPAISYHLSLRPLFCLFLSGRFRQVLLYIFGTFTWVEPVLGSEGPDNE